MRNDWLITWLKDWAEWVESINPYSGSTILSRAMEGQLTDNGGFKSVIPNGVEPEAIHIKQIEYAMNKLSNNPRNVQYIMAVRLYYLVGPKKAAKLLGKEKTTAFRHRKRGENKIRKFLQSRNKRQDT